MLLQSVDGDRVESAHGLVAGDANAAGENASAKTSRVFMVSS
jgi:hypothetical protein